MTNPTLSTEISSIFNFLKNITEENHSRVTNSGNSSTAWLGMRSINVYGIKNKINSESMRIPQ